MALQVQNIQDACVLATHEQVNKSGDSTEEQFRRVQDGLSELTNVAVSQRRMTGHPTSIVLSGQLFN